MQISRRSIKFKPRPSTASTPNLWTEIDEATGNDNPTENDPDNSSFQGSTESPRELSTEANEEHPQEMQINDEFLASYRDLERENEDLRRSLNIGNRTVNNSNDALLNSISGFLNSSQFKIPASTVGHCRPQDGTTLQITDWEVWRKRFESWLNVNGVEDSEKKQEFFNIMSGDQLYLALQTAPAIKGSLSSHYERTVEQLNGVFRARANNFALKTGFRSTVQEKTEKNVDYLSRLMKSALRIWERSDPAIDSEILLCVAVNGQPKLQEFTMKLCDEASEKQNYESLVNQARVLDNLAELTASKASACSILAVEKRESYTPRHVYTGNRNLTAGTNQMMTKPRQQSSNERFRECYRCGSTKHMSYKCDKFESSCGFCGIKGHIEDVCRKKRHLHRSSDSTTTEIKKQRLDNSEELMVENSSDNKV